MTPLNSTLRILEKTNLAREIDAFLIDRCARALSPRTIDYYDDKLTLSRTYLQAQGIRAVESITAPIVRRRAGRASVPAPTLHSFRRAFALACLRGKMNVYSL